MFFLVNIAMHCLQTIAIYWNVNTGTLNSWKRLNQSWSFWHQQGGESRKGLKKTAAVNEGRGRHGLDSVLSFGILAHFGDWMPRLARTLTVLYLL